MHTLGVRAHDIEIRAGERCEVELVDDQEVQARDPRPALARGLLSGGHVDHVAGEVGELRADGGGEIVAARFDQAELRAGKRRYMSVIAQKSSEASSRTAVCGHPPVSTPSTRSGVSAPASIRERSSGRLFGQSDRHQGAYTCLPRRFRLSQTFRAVSPGNSPTGEGPGAPEGEGQCCPSAGDYEDGADREQARCAWSGGTDVDWIILVNEEILRRAAGAAVTSGDADAVILFGSRALGTAGPRSDWDVCIVGGRGEREAVDAIVGHDSLVDEEALDILWVPSAKSFADVPAATVWADIVRCGQVIGGDRGMLRNIEVKPFSVERIEGQMGMAVEMIEAAVEAGERFRMSGGADRQQRRALRATLESAHAAEALTIVFCALADTRHLAGHVQGKVADLIRERARVLDDRVDRATVSRMAECAEEMNGNVKAAHGAPYSLVPESESQWCKRLLWAMRSHGELVEGIVFGDGADGGVGCA